VSECLQLKRIQAGLTGSTGLRQRRSTTARIAAEEMAEEENRYILVLFFFVSFASSR
jgi:hypothetical protein